MANKYHRTEEKFFSGKCMGAYWWLLLLS